MKKKGNAEQLLQADSAIVTVCATRSARSRTNRANVRATA